MDSEAQVSARDTPSLDMDKAILVSSKLCQALIWFSSQSWEKIPASTTKECEIDSIGIAPDPAVKAASFSDKKENECTYHWGRCSSGSPEKGGTCRVQSKTSMCKQSVLEDIAKHGRSIESESLIFFKKLEYTCAQSAHECNKRLHSLSINQ